MPSRRHRLLLVVLVSVLVAGVAPFVGSTVRASTPGFELGSVSARGDWTTVTLGQSFTDPVVVIGVPSINGRDPIQVRVRNVGPQSFEVRMAEWAYLDGSHAEETVSYLVLEPGAHTIGGRRWFAGHADGIDHTWARVQSGQSSFGGGQTVLTTVVTERGSEPVAPRVKSISGGSFDLRLEEEHGRDGRHAPERVDYVMAPCCGGAGELAEYRAGKASVADAATITWSPTLVQPHVFAQVASVSDPDTVTLRLANTSGGSAEIILQEEASDGESSHGAEEVRFVALSAPTSGSVTNPSPTTTAPPPASSTPSATATCLRAPAGAVRVRPADNLAALAQSHPAGTSFELLAGTHRAVQVNPKDGQKFYGERDAACGRLATVSGAVPVSGWQKVGTVWVASGHQQSVPSRSVPCEPEFPRCNHPQDLYLNGSPLHHVGTRNQVVAGTWHFDTAAGQLVMGSSPTGNVELSVTRAAFMPTSPNVTVAGLNLVRYANQPQHGVVGNHGTKAGWLIAENRFEWSHALAAVVGPSSTFRDNIVLRMGGISLKAMGNDATVVGNELAFGGWAGVQATWEGGGLKLSAARVQVERNCVHHNRGSGLWGDEGAYDAQFTRNVVFENAQQGIFYEISQRATITNNLVGHNGERFPWLYGGQIMVSTSSDVTVAGNRVEVAADKGNAITIVWQDRQKGTESVRNTIRDNDVTFLGRSGVAGMRTDFQGGTAIYDRNTFQSNRYHSPAPSFEYFKGRNGSATLSGIKQQGQESGSTIDSTVNPITWSCALRA